MGAPLTPLALLRPLSHVAARSGRGGKRVADFVGKPLLRPTSALHVCRKDEPLVDEDQRPPFITGVERPSRLSYKPSRSRNLLTLLLRKLTPSDRAQNRASSVQLRHNLRIDVFVGGGRELR